MPELPEVETVRIGLSSLLPGKSIRRVKFDWPKSFPNAQSDADSFLVNAKITNVRRRAKVLMIDLSTGYSLVIHLKMTGQLVFRSNDNSQNFGAGHPNDSLVGNLPDRSTRVTLDLGDSKLYFNDQRKFGWMRLIPTVEIPEIDFFKKIGPEPLAGDFTSQDFIICLKKKPNMLIKAALLDQSVIAGIGNIYADESLFASKIHPTSRVKGLSENELAVLFREIQAILRLSIKKGGSSDKNYVDAFGRKGSYLSFAKVFRRNGLPCPRCGTIIQKSKVAGRGTHTCPNCQPIPRGSS